MWNPRENFNNALDQKRCHCNLKIFLYAKKVLNDGPFLAVVWIGHIWKQHYWTHLEATLEYDCYSFLLHSTFSSSLPCALPNPLHIKFTQITNTNTNHKPQTQTPTSTEPLEVQAEAAAQ